MHKIKKIIKNKTKIIIIINIKIHTQNAPNCQLRLELPFNFFFFFFFLQTTHHMSYLRIKCLLNCFLKLGKLIFFRSFGTSDHIRGPRTYSDLQANLASY